MIRVIFFSLEALADRDALRSGVSEQIAQIMARRYGGMVAAWAAARRRVLADWDSYYADLNLSGDDGVADMWEGEFRTTRALFRLARIPEPPKAELTALSRELAAQAAAGCDALSPGVTEALRQLAQAGFALGALTHSSTAFLRGVLAGGGVLPLFSAPLIGTDTAERFEWDATYFVLAARRASAAASACLMVDARADVLAQAQTAAMQTAHIGTHAPGGGLLALAISLTSRSG